eukprot:gene6928-7705_t
MPKAMEVLLCRWIRPHHYIVLMGSLSILAFITAETGTKPPESCVFGFFLNLSSVLAFVCMFIRHENYADQVFIESQSSHFVNDLGLFIGFLSALGMCIVANFQESNVLSVHLVGASMVFGFAFIGASVANVQWKDATGKKGTKMFWNKDEPGYNWHLTSTFSEWLMALSFICFFFTFYAEFGKIRITAKVHQRYRPDSSGSPEVLNDNAFLA